MRKITLTQGHATLVDDVDFEGLSKHKWHAVETDSGLVYAVRHPGPVKGRKHIYMHQAILGIQRVDHKDGNGLNNQRENLRKATQQQNLQNRRKTSSPTSSKYKGVVWDKARKVWIAFCQGKFIGRFQDEGDAARAYDIAARQRFGEFARCNFGG